MIPGLVIGIFTILLIVLVVAPLMSRARRIASGASGECHAIRSPPVAGKRYRGTSPSPPPSVSGPHFGMTEEEATLNAGRIEGQLEASSVNKVGEIVSKHPEEALSIIRSWMYQGA
jgi:flagellar M-ring protein FliF